MSTHVDSTPPDTAEWGDQPLERPQAVARMLDQLQLGRFSGVLILAAIVMVFAIWVPETFLTSVTWKTILTSQAITGILALAILWGLATGSYDLSAAQAMGFCALVSGWLMTEGGVGVFPAILLTVATGVAIGMFNGFLCAVLGLNSFIATLGTTSLLVGLGAAIADGTYIGPLPETMTGFTSGEVLGVPILAVYLVVVALFVWYALEHTPIGRHAYATGANPDAARLSGIRTRRFVFWSLVTCSTIAAVAGVLLASSLNSVNQTLGPQYLLPAFAAAFLGTTQIKPGRFNVGGTILAVMLLATGIQGLQLVGAELWIRDVFYGAALILAISVSLTLQRIRGRRELRATEAAADESHATEVERA